MIADKLNEEENIIPKDKCIDYLFHDLMNYLMYANNSYYLLNNHLREDNSIDHKSDKLLRMAQKGFNELTQLCQTYKLLLRNEYDVNVQETKMLSLIYEAFNIVSGSFSLDDDILILDVPKDLTITTDRVLFVQCLVNLLKNAIEHQANSDTKQITITSHGNSISIVNKIIRPAENDKRKGLGQSIVSKISDILDFDVVYIEDIYYKVVIRF